MAAFQLVSKFQPTGDQPEAISQLVSGLKRGDRHQVLKGATGTGKTFTIANVIAEVQNPPWYWPTTRPWQPSSTRSFASSFPTTPSSTSSPITTTTNLRPISLNTISTSRKTRTSTRRSTV